MPVPPLSRRAVLQLGGASALAFLGGCTGGDDDPDGPGAKGAEPDPDLELLATAIADKQDLVKTYLLTLSAHPQLATRLKPLGEDHTAHLAALTGFRPDLPTAAPSATGSPRPSSDPGPSVPTDRAQAVEALAKAEIAAAGRRVGQCESARDPQLARLLASIGGSEAAHTAVLRKSGGS